MNELCARGAAALVEMIASRKFAGVVDACVAVSTRSQGNAVTVTLARMSRKREGLEGLVSQRHRC